jgi:hypothetical protein
MNLKSGEESHAVPATRKKTLDQWLVMGETFVLENDFTVTDYLGSGAYGVVCSALNTQDRCKVAVKKYKVRLIQLERKNCFTSF